MCRRKWINRLILILGVCCLVLGCYLIYSDYSYRVDLERSIETELESHIVEVTPIPEKEGIDNKSSKKKIEKSTNKTKKTYKNVLKIPDLNLIAPILPDISKESLRKGAGHYPDTVDLGGNGNCVLAGHSSLIYNCIFDPLHNIELGTEVYVFDEDCTKYKYVVTEIKDKIDPYDVSVLDSPNTNEGYLTLLTCTDYGKKRFAVVCEMEESYGEVKK